jgi:hypothetical protein
MSIESLGDSLEANHKRNLESHPNFILMPLHENRENL